MKRLLAAALLVSAAYLVSQPAPPERVGRGQGDEETRAAIEIVALGFGEAD